MSRRFVVGIRELWIRNGQDISVNHYNHLLTLSNAIAMRTNTKRLV
jgi:hypothetical protein